MWQMTVYELVMDSFKPVRENMHPGAWAYACPLCNSCVGIYHENSNEVGFIYKRDICQNGHAVDWNIDVPEQGMCEGYGD